MKARPAPLYHHHDSPPAIVGAALSIFSTLPDAEADTLLTDMTPVSGLGFTVLKYTAECELAVTADCYMSDRAWLLECPREYKDKTHSNNGFDVY